MDRIEQMVRRSVQEFEKQKIVQQLTAQAWLDGGFTSFDMQEAVEILGEYMDTTESGTDEHRITWQAWEDAQKLRDTMCWLEDWTHHYLTDPPEYCPHCHRPTVIELDGCEGGPIETGAFCYACRLSWWEGPEYGE